MTKLRTKAQAANRRTYDPARRRHSDYVPQGYTDLQLVRISASVPSSVLTLCPGLSNHRSMRLLLEQVRQEYSFRPWTKWPSSGTVRRRNEVDDGKLGLQQRLL